MNLKKKVTITLSRRDVKEIIANYLTEQGYKVYPNNITMCLGAMYDNYGVDGKPIPYFKECTAVVDDESDMEEEYESSED